MRVLNRASVALCIVITASVQPVLAQSDVWHILLRSMEFVDINRAQLEFDCTETPQYMSNPRLKGLCAKRNQIPDYIIEEAALPYLRQYVSERVANQAIDALKAEDQRALSNKLNQEIASGRRDRLTAADIDLLEKRNATEYGHALSAFASDKEQGRAVARAMLNYQP